MPTPLLRLPGTIAASCALMRPLGTPPYAIVFGTWVIRMPPMIKTGFRLNVRGILPITVITYFILGPALAAR